MEIIKKLAEELNLSKEAVESAYRAYWKFIREKISSLPLKKNISKEDFDKLKTNFNLPALGKLYCDYNKWEIITKYIKENPNIKNYDKYKKGKTDIQRNNYNDEYLQ